MKGAAIGNLTEEIVSCKEELLEALQRGERERSYASTAMNAESSRSHTIYRMMIDVKEEKDETDESVSGQLVRPKSYIYTCIH